MLVLGIDPGFALTGWCVLKKQNEPKLIAYGCITTAKNKDLSIRILELFNQLKKIIKKYKPNIIALEKIFFNTNAKTAFMVGEARGVIKICSLLNNIPLIEFTPLQIKSCIVGYGRADKNQVQQMIKVLLKLDKIPKPDDAADAAATALTYCYYKSNLAK